MASPFQQQSRIRKFVYAGLILLLLTLSYPLRHSLILAQASDLTLRPEGKGQVELAGSAFRLVLTGTRGMAVCYMWIKAQDKKKKHEWHELDMVVKTVVKLQPHFILPWLFQSWNMAFNVSAEFDRIRDKYFWISSGIQLLAEGVNVNRGNDDTGFPGNPDLRFHMGLYYQLKIGRSDENLTMRSLYQLSCMKLADRDPDRLRLADRAKDGRLVINFPKFEEFCNKHPRLVRRLREKLSMTDPRQVINFLRENRDIPCRYDPNIDKLKPNAEDRFPVLPPQFGSSEPFDEDKKDANDPDSPYGSALGDDFDNFIASRAWYVYSEKPLPPPDPNFGVEGWQIDTRRYRLPRMSQYLFRQYQAMAQEFAAETLAEEEWFDDAGWRMEWTDEQGRPRRRLVGKGVLAYSSQAAWESAYLRYRSYGEKTRLIMPDEKLGPLAEEYTRLKARAEAYQKAYQSGTDSLLGPRAQDRTGPMAKNFKAHSILIEIARLRGITNFANHYHQATVEKLPQAAAARKAHADAQNAWALGQRKRAMELYQSWFDKWIKLLEKNPDFRRNLDVQDETYRNMLWYFRNMQKYYEPVLKHAYTGAARAVLWPPLARSVALVGNQRTNLDKVHLLWLADPLYLLTKAQQQRLNTAKNIRGPFDGNDPLRPDREYFEPEQVERIRLEVMYRGSKVGPQPTRRMPQGLPPRRTQPDQNQ
jgi:hypothetical protein